MPRGLSVVLSFSTQLIVMATLRIRQVKKFTFGKLTFLCLFPYL